VSLVISDAIRDLGAGITRRLPHLRGLTRAYMAFNRTMLSLGAKPVVTVRMKDGTSMKLDLRTKTELPGYYRGEYDPDLMRVVRAVFDSDSVFIDIGANIGFYTVAVGNFIRNNGASGRVLGFEPYEGNYNRILENLKANGLEDLCSVFRVGLSNGRHEGYLVLREDFELGSVTGNTALRISEEFDAGFPRVRVQLERLDDIWSGLQGKYGSIDFIKIDVEGHEDACLQGSLQTIRTHRPTILMEVNKPYYLARGLDVNDTLTALIPDDYLIYRRSGRRWVGIESLQACDPLDNVFLVPREKAVLERFRVLA
jgi:FkbM family methyltransferase